MSLAGENGIGIEAPKLAPSLPRGLCTDCGLSRTAEAKLCGKACQFIKPNYPAMEAKLHGRGRDPERSDEAFFGVYRQMLRGSLVQPLAGAQWSGITTRIGARLLETGAVDAILTVAADPADRWRPVPVIVTEPQQMANARGMRMGYAPVLSLLESARSKGYRRLAVIGIPCQVYALRSIQETLGLEELYVIGTPCSDNTTTENFHQFLSLLTPDPASVTYLEFCTDYHVEMRFQDGGIRRVPYLMLPLSQLPANFFPLTCRTCVDYTNSLADLTVGYLGGDGEQWLLARNERGERLLNLLGPELKTSALTDAGKRHAHVVGFKSNVELAAGGLPVRRMPRLMRRIVGWLMPKIGPRGLEFARARIEMKAIETVLHLRQAEPRRVKSMVPPHVWRLAKRYGLQPTDAE